MKRKLFFLFFIFFIVLGFINVYANTIPYYYEYNGDGYGLVVNKNTGLKVKKETIIFQLEDSKPEIVTYKIENSNNINSVMLAFPYSIPAPAKDNKKLTPAIYQDGQKIKFKDVGIELYDLYSRKEDVKVDNQRVLDLAIKNINNQEYENENNYSDSNIRVLLFELDLNDKKETTLKIEYYQFPYESCEFTEKWIYTYEYYLAPAKNFDSFGKLIIKVIPENKYSQDKRNMVESNIIFKKNGNEYIYEGEGIPADTLAFSMYEDDEAVYTRLDKEGKRVSKKDDYVQMWIAAIIAIFLACIAVLVIVIALLVNLIRYIKRRKNKEG